MARYRLLYTVIVKRDFEIRTAEARNDSTPIVHTVRQYRAGDRIQFASKADAVTFWLENAYSVTYRGRTRAY